ncbi:MAG: family 78 glycoside hydrolase catalytic domain [Sedimentisphaerales bacterium]|nr:family 78 glycoside hydrolase catalytic domain [Sedimentisphaerales bacterium]
MKTNIALPANLRVVFFCLLLLAMPLRQIFALSPEAPDNLRCCDKTNPVGTEAKPYFGWYVNDPDDDEIQTAYQIIVASSTKNLNADKGDLWDSGRISSGKQNYIFYGGNSLEPATRYYWKVRTWDKDGNAGPYSAAAVFDTGLFTSDDFSGASWIKRDTRDADDYTFFRKKITLPAKKIKRAVVYVTACHNYELYINGTLIGKGLAYHYPQYQYYNAYDVSDVFIAGRENAFACLTHWFGGGQGRATGSRGFLLKAVIEYGDSTSTVVGTDETWKHKQAEAWATGQRRRNGEGVGYIEKIDAGKIIPDWNKLDYDDSSWPAAAVIGAPPVSPWTENLQSDLTRLIEEEITPVSVTELGTGKYVIDLGKVYPGTPRITFSGGTAGTTVNMRGGYTLEDDGTVSTRTTQNTDMSYYFILDGGPAVFESKVYLGMRYFQVDNSPNVLTTENVGFTCRHYELDPSRSRFSSSNDMLNKVWELMKHSLIVGAQEEFVDTPTREKGGFLGDSWAQGVPAMTTMGDRAMNLRVMLEFLDSQDQYWPDGRLNAVYPNSDGARDIPDYTQSYLVWVWDYYMLSGNKEFLNDNYDRLKKIADYVNAYRNETTGLIHNLAGGGGSYRYGIIDWPAHMRYGYDVSTESRTVIDAYAYIDFDIISKIAGVLGNTADCDTYRKMANDMKSAINSRLINAQGVYIDGLYADQSQSSHVSQHANMFPMAMGIVPEANIEAVVAAIKERQMSVGMVTVRWLPESIGRAEQGPHLIELYTNTDWDGWAKTVSLGGTATWECWDALTNGQSMSHPWGVAGLLGIQQYILGILPLEPQHEKIRIRPLDFEQKLSSASGTLPTDRGEITIDWNRSSERFLLNLTIPDNITAEVCIPKCGSTGAVIKVDGENVTGKDDGNYISVENIGSGSHTFERAAAG